MQKIKVCIIGMGEFSDFFIDLFKMHPDVDEVSIADLVPERVEAAAKKFKITRTFSSLDDVLENGKDVNCIAIFTQRHLHGNMAIKALEAGKHVFSAVPISTSIEDVQKIIELTEKTRLTYMTGETCYYFPCAVFCREAYKEGKFGEFVYGEAQYYHDMVKFYGAFSRSGGKNWKMDAGIPPMYYCTHSISMILSVINERVKKVSCMGYRDHSDDDVFGAGKNHWDNPFSNETALMYLSNGGVARINEFRRIGTAAKPSSYITGFYGTTGAYEASADHHVLITGDAASTDPRIEYVGDLVNTEHYVEDKNAGKINVNEDPISEFYHKGYAKVQDVSRLPKAYRSLPHTVHYNSHGFLVDDFVRSVMTGQLPPNNAWDSASYMVPGIIAHESAMQGGVLLDVPDFGEAPADWQRLVYDTPDYYENDTSNKA